MRTKVVLLQCLKLLGVFALCRTLTRRKLRIICYHGFSVGDQHEYNPMLFMTAGRFRARMQMLKRLGYPVVRLEDALFALDNNAIQNCETVITIDDGWRTTETIGTPILQSLNYPATIYVTTYNCERNVEVFTVALNYLLWRTQPRSVTVQGIDPRVDGTYAASGTTSIAEQLTQRAETHLDAEQRQQLIQQLAAQVDAAFAQELTDGRFRLMNAQSVAALARVGFDIQLHTHRHRISMTDPKEVHREILDNRERLEAWTGVPARHFCYPSGRHNVQHAAWLAAVNVESATTCEPGLNDGGTDRYALRRFLDSETLSDIEFEAELAGVGNLLRRCKKSLVRRSVRT